MSSTGAKTFVVRVGNDNNDFVFAPTEVTASVGSTIQFQFMSGNHSAVRSTFANPCLATPDGFNSGYFPTSAGIAKGQIPTFTILVNDTSPIVYFCAQARHCRTGMVGVINPKGSVNFNNVLAAATSSPDSAGEGTSTRSTASSTSPATAQTQSGTGPATSTPPGQQQTEAPAGETGFSRGAAVGVGIGVALVLVLVGIIAAAWFLLRRRRRRREAETKEAALLGSPPAQKLSAQKPELEAVPANGPIAYELDSMQRRAELAEGRQFGVR